jgi:hypothetical protein
MASKFVCVKCRKFLKIKKNGVVVEEMRPSSGIDGQMWLPYKMYMTDLWECRESEGGCGFEMAYIAVAPFAEHYEKHYESMKTTRPPMVQVEDC